MTQRSITVALACLIGGTVVIAASAGLNLQAALFDTLPRDATILDALLAGLVSPVGVAILAIAFGSAAAVSVITLASKYRQWTVVVLCLLGMVVAEAYSAQLTAERILAVRAAKVELAQADNQPRRIVEGRIERLRDELRAAGQAVIAETKNGGCGRICRGLKSEAARVRKALTTAEAELGSLPPERVENHLQAVTGVPAVWIDLFNALCGAIALFAFGAAFIGLGTWMLIDDRQPAAPSQSAAAEPEPLTRDAALDDLRVMLRKSGHIPEQQFLVDRWGVSEGCVSKWLTHWERSGLVSRMREGKSNVIRLAA
jgi:hypothetical protein